MSHCSHLCHIYPTPNSLSPAPTSCINITLLMRMEHPYLPRGLLLRHFTANDKEYILLYFIPSMILFLVFVVLLPLLLLQYRILVFESCLEKVSFSILLLRYVFFSTHFKVVSRSSIVSFARLYFLFRLMINTSIMLNEAWLQQCTVQLGACIIMVMLILSTIQ